MPKLLKATIERLEKLLISQLPVIKIEKKKFLIGPECKQLEEKENDLVLVKVGGGYEELT